MALFDKIMNGLSNKNKEDSTGKANMAGNLLGTVTGLKTKILKMKITLGLIGVCSVIFVIAFIIILIIGPLYSEDKTLAKMWQEQDAETYTAFQQELVDKYPDKNLSEDMSTYSYNEETQAMYYERLEDAYTQYLKEVEVSYDAEGNFFQRLWNSIKALFTGKFLIDTEYSYGVEIDARLITSTLYADRFFVDSLDNDDQEETFYVQAEDWKYRNLHSKQFRDETEKKYLEDAMGSFQTRSMLAINGIEILSKYLIKRTETYFSVDDYTQFEFHDTTRNIDVKYESLIPCIEETLTAHPDYRLCNGSCDNPQPVSVGQYEVSSGGDWNFYVCAEYECTECNKDKNHQGSHTNQETLSLAIADFDDYCLTGHCSYELAINTTSTCPGGNCPLVTPSCPGGNCPLVTPSCPNGQCGAPVYTGPSEIVQGFTSDRTSGCKRWEVVIVPECPVEYADDSTGEHGSEAEDNGIDYIRYDIDCETYENYMYQVYPLEEHIRVFNAQDTYKTKFIESYYHEYLGNKEEDPELWEIRLNTIVGDNIYGMAEFYQNAEQHYSVCFGGSGVSTTGDLACNNGAENYMNNNYDNFIPPPGLIPELSPEELEELLEAIELLPNDTDNKISKELLEIALSYIGKYGGSCNKFIEKVYKEAGIPLSGMTYDMFAKTKENLVYFNEERNSDLKDIFKNAIPGDLVFFKARGKYIDPDRTGPDNPYQIQHIAIFLGWDTNGNPIVADSNTKASTEATGVKENVVSRSPMNSENYHIVGITRPFASGR